MKEMKAIIPTSQMTTIDGCQHFGFPFFYYRCMCSMYAFKTGTQPILIYDLSLSYNLWKVKKSALPVMIISLSFINMPQNGQKITDFRDELQGS